MKTIRFLCSTLFLITFIILLSFSAFAEAEIGPKPENESKEASVTKEENSTKEETETKAEILRVLNVTLSEPEGADVNIKVDGVEQTGLSMQVKLDSRIEVTITPNQGYNFEQWVATPLLSEIADPTATSISFKMPDTDVTLAASLQKHVPQNYSFRLIINDTSFGTASVNGDYWGATNKEKMILEGTEVVLKANPNAGYKFSKWTCQSGPLKDADLSGSEISFTMPAADVEIYLEFEAVVYYFEVIVQGEGTVELDGKEVNSAGKYECTVGEEIPILATPAEEYVFTGWYSNNYADFENFDEAATTLICPASDFSITANFASSVKELTLASSEGGTAVLTLNSSDGALVPSGEPIRCGVDQIYKLIATPSTGYVFSHWECSVTTGNFSDEKDDKADFTMPNEDCTVTAVFVKGSYKVILEQTAGGEASVTEGLFEMGTKVELKAAPLAGYVFSRWECAMEGVVEDPAALTTNAVIPGSDVVIRAVFTLQATFTPNVSSGQDLDDEGGFPWVAIIVVLFLSVSAIVLIIVRERYNLSYRYLIKKFLKKQ